MMRGNSGNMRRYRENSEGKGQDVEVWLMMDR